MKTYIPVLILIIAASFTGCSSVPEFDTQGVNQFLTPAQASKSPQQTKGKTIIWGGMILSIANLPNQTQLEILSYPLNDNQRPQPNAEPSGRFILKKQGYLESAEYSVGRYITVRGQISGMEQGIIGKAEYTYPVIKTEQLYLWSKNFAAEQTRIHFGIGVIYGQ